MAYRHFAFLLTALALCACSATDDFDLERLDAVLKDSYSYVAAHERQVQSVESTLISEESIPDSVRFAIYGRLYELDYSFQFEKALKALNRQEEIADASGRKDWMAQVMLHKAMLSGTAGLFSVSASYSERIDTSLLSRRDIVDYYEYRQHFCNDYYRYKLPEKDEALLSEAVHSRSRVIELTQEGSFVHSNMVLQNYIDAGQFDRADSVAAVLTDSLSADSHEYAIASYFRGVVCYLRNDLKGERKWYVESAIADIKTATKDNASLYSLALNLLNVNDDIERSFHYTQLALDDALFYNAKLRPFQIAQNLPKIEHAFAERIDRTQRRQRTLLIIVSILAVGLLVVASVVISYQSRLRKAVADLSEASAAKEEYLALFLSMSSGYLDKLRHYLSRAQMEAELRDFYQAFDNAFIRLYPTFVEDFNALLVPESRVELKSGELLNTQLRIFALIRMGIDQSSHIASLLRYSVNTIYNYRAQTKAAAISGKDDFETRVRAIGKKL